MSQCTHPETQTRDTESGTWWTMARPFSDHLEKLGTCGLHLPWTPNWQDLYLDSHWGARDKLSIPRVCSIKIIPDKAPPSDVMETRGHVTRVQSADHLTRLTRPHVAASADQWSLRPGCAGCTEASWRSSGPRHPASVIPSLRPRYIEPLAGLWASGDRWQRNGH